MCTHIKLHICIPKMLYVNIYGNYRMYSNVSMSCICQFVLNTMKTLQRKSLLVRGELYQLITVITVFIMSPLLC